MIRCEECGRQVKIGDWPFCPHDTVRSRAIFKPYWDTNIAEQPVYIESDHQHQRIMKENKMEPKEREHLADVNHRRWGRGLPELRD
jgi:hypothetical protein